MTRRILLAIATTSIVAGCSNVILSKNDLAAQFVPYDQILGKWVCGADIGSSGKIEIQKNSQLALYRVRNLDSAQGDSTKSQPTHFRIINTIQDKKGSGAFVQVMTEQLRSTSDNGYVLAFLRIVGPNEFRFYIAPHISDFQRAASPNQQVASVLGKIGIGTSGPIDYEIKDTPVSAEGKKQSIVVIKSSSPQVKVWLADQNESLFVESEGRCIR